MKQDRSRCGKGRVRLGAKWLVATCLLVTGCATTHPVVPPQPVQSASEVALYSPNEVLAEYDRLAKLSPIEMRDRLAELEGISVEDFQSRYILPERPLGYSPLEAEGLETIHKTYGSNLDLASAGLESTGFAFVPSVSAPSFLYGYKSLYAEHLPLYITADSILRAVYTAFDTHLVKLEVEVLRSHLTTLLSETRKALLEGKVDAWPQEVREDVDLHASVALSFVSKAPVSPIYASNANVFRELTRLAMAENGEMTLNLFGRNRHVDFSQFKPRGHYTGELEGYFRAVVWLGRIGFDMVADENGKLVFNRRGFDAVMAMRTAVGERGFASWATMDSRLSRIVGEQDSMRLSEVDDLVKSLGVAAPAETIALSDGAVENAVRKSRFGEQKIRSYIAYTDETKGEGHELSRSFHVLGQRYVVDAEVFTKLVHPEVNRRLMPDSLDVAFAVFGNDAATELLELETNKPAYRKALAQARMAVDAHGSGYWQKNLYSSWLGALRALSPREAPENVPAIVRSSAWNRRVMNTQLASWAELRNTTVAYAKQSYSGSVLCEFPDAYVDPYPRFYEQIQRFAKLGQSVFHDTDPTVWVTLEKTAVLLEDMAIRELAGEPLTDVQMAFVNDAVAYHYKGGSCGGPPDRIDGWYAELYDDPVDAQSYDPKIPEVHTQPTDQAGNTVGRILHAASGDVRYMVVTVDTCDGPRAYIGPVSSYHQVITKDFKRLSDQEWARMARKAESPPWMSEEVPGL